MISAVRNGKYSVERIEDVLTASFFNALLLLPDDLIWKILRDACYGKELLPEKAGALQFDRFSFWPPRNPAGIGNTNFVKPDAFIPFDNLDLVVEAKLSGNNQNKRQWKNEIIAYHNEHGDDEKKVFLLAIDGLADNTKSEAVPLAGRNRDVTIVKSDWARLLDVLQREQSRQKHAGGNDTVYCILNMAIGWLTNFGYGMTWLDGLVSESFVLGLSISNYGKDLKLLKTFGGQDE